MATAAPTLRANTSRDIPGIGRIDFEQTDKRREYWLLPEGKERRVKLPSVTTILRATWPGSEGLLQWRGRLGNAEAKRVSDESMAIGNDVHRFIEVWLTTGKVLGFGDFPENRKPFLQGAVKFLVEHEPTAMIGGVEKLVCHPEHKYAGRLDTLGVLKDSDALTLLDYKTSAGGNIYAKGHVQGWAYAMADHRCGGERVERIMVVGISGDGTFRVVETPQSEASDVWSDVLTYYGSMTRLLKALGEKAP